MPENQIQVELIDHCGSDLTFVNAARVSFAKESDWVWEGMSERNFQPPKEHEQFTGGAIRKLSEQDTKLIRYLAKHKHKSPFNHAFMSFRVTAPVFVARQLVKHEYLCWNEISRRYVDDEPVFYEPNYWRKRAENKKQGSSDEKVNVAFYDKDDGYNDWPTEAVAVAKEAYEEMLKLGVAPEQARMILPQSMITQWYWSGTFGAFAKMCALRTGEDTQYETRLVAVKVWACMEKLFPVATQAWKDYPIL